jgi:hypothetical protein
MPIARCDGTKGNGARCKGEALGGSKWCYSHHPDHRESLRRNGSKGGKRSGRGRHKRTVTEVDAVMVELDEVLELVRSGEMERADGAVIGQLLNLKLRGIEVKLKAREHDEWGERLAAIEEHQEQWANARSGVG